MSSEHRIGEHRLTLLRNGEEYFPALIAALDAAQSSVYLETYIFAADATGRQVADALMRAAARRVRVHLLLDGFGSAQLPETWQQALRDAGVRLLWFRRDIAPYALRRRRLRRLHRKLALVDECVAFIGGINIVDDVAEAMDAPRLDYAVRVEGPVVARVKLTMRQLWSLVSWASFRTRRLRSRPGEPAASQPVRLVLRDNLRHRRDIERAYLNAIDGAKQELIIANAYFLPGRRFRRALRDAVQRGVRVVLLLQGRVEYRLQHYATQALYDELLRDGVEIHEYTASFLHAKVAVADARWATVGSSNIDPFSLWLAREANLEVESPEFASALRNDLLAQMQGGAHRVDAVAWQRQGWLWHWLSMASYALVRLLAGVAGYARERDDI